MFEKLKQLKELKQLRDSLAREKAEAEKNGVKVVVNGKMEVELVRLNPDIQKEKQEIILQECLNEALRKIQMVIAQKMSSQMGGFF